MEELVGLPAQEWLEGMMKAFRVNTEEDLRFVSRQFSEISRFIDENLIEAKYTELTFEEISDGIIAFLDCALGIMKMKADNKETTD